MIKYLLFGLIAIVAMACGNSATSTGSATPQFVAGEATSIVHSWIAEKDQTRIPESDCLVAMTIVLDDPLWNETYLGEGDWQVTIQDDVRWIVNENSRKVTPVNTSYADLYCN